MAKPLPTRRGPRAKTIPPVQMPGSAKGVLPTLPKPKPTPVVVGDEPGKQGAIPTGTRVHSYHPVTGMPRMTTTGGMGAATTRRTPGATSNTAKVRKGVR